MACSQEHRNPKTRGALEERHSRQPSISVDGCTTTPATQASGALKKASEAWLWGGSPAGATQPNTKGSAWKPDLAQTGALRDANLAPCYAKPSDNKAKAAPRDQTNDNRVQSPESCTDRQDWHAPCDAPAMPQHQNAKQEQGSQ